MHKRDPASRNANPPKTGHTMEVVYWSVVLCSLAAVLGKVSSLECLVCDFDAKNSTVDDKCLAAPYRAEAVTCPVGKGLKTVCQIRAVFDIDQGEMSLTRLNRMCGFHHDLCNNACSDMTMECWMCCNDNNKCNSFPLRANAVLLKATNAATNVAYTKGSMILFLIIHYIMDKKV